MRLQRSLALLLLVSLLTTACPSQSDLTRAAKASNELAHDVVLAEKAVGAVFKADRISRDAKDRYAAALKSIATNGKRFNNSLVELDKKYPEGKTPPPETLQFLRENWREVSAPFAALLAELNLFGLGDAVKELKGDVGTIDKVLSK